MHVIYTADFICVENIRAINEVRPTVVIPFRSCVNGPGCTCVHACTCNIHFNTHVHQNSQLRALGKEITCGFTGLFKMKGVNVKDHLGSGSKLYWYRVFSVLEWVSVHHWFRCWPTLWIYCGGYFDSSTYSNRPLNLALLTVIQRIPVLRSVYVLLLL